MQEQDFVVDTASHRLAGTVCLPDKEGPFTFVLMVHGSGPLDRDENTGTHKLNVFNAFAHHLADAGIASLRYDKRGIGESSGDFFTASGTDLIEDALACLDAMGQRQDCDPDRIYVLGHSEGTTIAPSLSIQRPGVAGIILVCPFGQPIPVVLAQQADHVKQAIQQLPGLKGTLLRLVTRISGDPAKSQQKFIAKLKRSTTPTIRHRFARVPAAWFREALELDPKPLFSQVTCPSYILAGAKDVQCDPADAPLIGEWIKGSTEVVVIDNLTHLLRYDFGEPSIFNYKQQLKGPVEDIVLEKVSGWILNQLSN